MINHLRAYETLIINVTEDLAGIPKWVAVSFNAQDQKRSATIYCEASLLETEKQKLEAIIGKGGGSC